MSAIPVTLFLSLVLAALFVVLFAREQSRRFTSAERDSLLPLADEGLQPVAVETDAPAADDDHDHDHAHPGTSACGCRDGLRPPCPGCLKRRSPDSNFTR